MASLLNTGYQTTSITGGADINQLNNFLEDALKKDEDIVLNNNNITCQNLDVLGTTTLRGTVEVVNVSDVNISDRTTIFGKGNTSYSNVALAMQDETNGIYYGILGKPMSGDIKAFKTTQNLVGNEVNELDAGFNLADFYCKNGYFNQLTLNNGLFNNIFFNSTGSSYLASGDTTQNNLLRLGIRTTTPSEALDVAGNIRASSGTLISNFLTPALNQIGLILRNVGFSTGGEVDIKFRTGHGSAQATIRGGSTTSTRKSYLSFRTNDEDAADTDTERMRIDNLGNVGIGTTAPTAKLQVNTTSGQTALLIKNTTSTPDNIFVVSNVNGSGVLNMGDRFETEGVFPYKIQLHTEGDSFFNGGNVGIGITAPTEKLDVVGNIKQSGYSIIPTNSFYNIDNNPDFARGLFRITRSDTTSAPENLVIPTPYTFQLMKITIPTGSANPSDHRYITVKLNYKISFTRDTQGEEFNNFEGTIALVISRERYSTLKIWEFSDDLRINQRNEPNVDSLIWNLNYSTFDTEVGGGTLQLSISGNHSTRNAIRRHINIDGEMYVNAAWQAPTILLATDFNPATALGAPNNINPIPAPISRIITTEGNISPNIGIGTTTPTEKLDVVGSAKVSTIFTVGDLINTPRRNCASLGFPTVGIQGGSLIYDTSSNILYCYNGTSWKALYL